MSLFGHFSNFNNVANNSLTREYIPVLQDDVIIEKWDFPNPPLLVQDIVFVPPDKTNTAIAGGFTLVAGIINPVFGAVVGAMVSLFNKGTTPKQDFCGIRFTHDVDKIPLYLTGKKRSDIIRDYFDFYIDEVRVEIKGFTGQTHSYDFYKLTPKNPNPYFDFYTSTLFSHIEASKPLNSNSTNAQYRDGSFYVKKTTGMFGSLRPTTEKLFLQQFLYTSYINNLIQYRYNSFDDWVMDIPNYGIEGIRYANDDDSNGNKVFKNNFLPLFLALLGLILISNNKK